MNGCVHHVLLTMVMLSLTAALCEPASASDDAWRSLSSLEHTIPFQAALAFADPAAAESDQWWSARTAGYFGAIGGSALGLLGAMIGVVGGAMRMWRFAVQALNVMIIIGVLGASSGFYAVFASQPYHVYYPLLLTGVLCLVLGIGLRFTFHAVRRQQELHKMRAMDAS